MLVIFLYSLIGAIPVYFIEMYFKKLGDTSESKLKFIKSLYAIVMLPLILAAATVHFKSNGETYSLTREDFAIIVAFTLPVLLVTVRSYREMKDEE